MSNSLDPEIMSSAIGGLEEAASLSATADLPEARLARGILRRRPTYIQMSAADVGRSASGGPPSRPEGLRDLEPSFVRDAKTARMFR